MSIVTQESSSSKRLKAGTLRRPRLGFLGVGWIGRHRLQAVAESGLAEIAAVADASREVVDETRKTAPSAVGVDSLEALLEQDLDGIVIATPSALHAGQSIAAFERGFGVFCQKPLARTASETRQIIAAARRADRLLGVDFSYRHVRGVPEMRQLIRSGELGDVYAVDLTFHNAYGPDKPWFYDPALSGGGCVIDLGTHLADLALWMFDFAEPANITSRLYRDGKPIPLWHGLPTMPPGVTEGLHERSGDLRSAAPAGSGDPRRTEVEDYAIAQWEFPGRATVRLACSWRLPAGQDCVIEAIFYGTNGAAALRNVNGSFYDFHVEHWVGTSRRVLAEPPDPWGGRAAVAWAEQLARGGRFDPECEHLVDVAALLDGIYRRCMF